MIYVKSVLAGLLALATVFIVLPILGMILYAVAHPQPDGGSIGWDPIRLFKQSPFLPITVAFLVFASGFYLEFRRLTHR
jgi:hypothetical protein